jgi:hypothetical protein
MKVRGNAEETRMRYKRVLPVFLCLLAGGAGVAFVWHVLVPVVRSHQVDKAIARFEASPSQSSTEELARLLDQGTPAREQGERILKVLLYPKTVTRSAYPPGARLVFWVERPFQVCFAHATVSVSEGLWVDGKEKYGGGMKGRNTLDTRPHWHFLQPEPQGPGSHRAEVRYEYALTLMTQETFWSWHPLRGHLPWSLLPQRGTRWSTPDSPPDYTCRFGVPVELKVVTRDAAERIVLLANPELDERMRGAFTAGPINMFGTYITTGGNRSYAGAIEIAYSALPSAVAFKSTLRLATGDEITARDKYTGRRRARANESGRFQISAPDFLLEKTGKHQGTIILTPDPNYAYEDPAIQAIWNGTLEFPIRFTISPDP